MKTVGSLQVSTPTEREIVMTRAFDAPRQLVFEAHTRPELIQRWLLGPDGWQMPVCEVDLRVGGRYRYVWRRERDGAEMGIAGVYREIVAPARLVNTEKFDDAWYPGEAVGTLVLSEERGGTLLTYTMLYESREARDTALKSGMETGVEASYQRLERVVATLAKAGPAARA